MTKKKVKLKQKIRLYDIVSGAVELGVGFGLNRAFKHVDDPDRSIIEDNVYRGVMNALCEVIDWEDEYEA